MSEHYDSDQPEEIGGVPVDGDMGNLPPVDDDVSGEYAYDDPVEPRIPRKQKPKDYTIPDGEEKKRPRWPLYLVIGAVMFCCLCWLACCAILAAFGGAAAVFANNEVTADGSLQRVIEADEDTVITLTVKNPTGRVRIRPGNSDEVKVDYTKKAFGLTTDMAQSGLDDISITLENAGSANRFSITAEKDDSPLHFLDHIDMTVYVPADVHLTVDTDTGAIEVEDVNVHSMNLSADTGAISFAGSLTPDDAGARFNLETKTGAVIVSLPSDVYARIDAKTDTGSVEVSPDFRDRTVESQDTNGPSQSWVGVLGEDSGTAPTLTLRSNTGAIAVDVK